MSPKSSGLVSAVMVWLIWVVYSDQYGVNARSLFRSALHAGKADWVGVPERALFFVQGVAVVVFPYSQAIMHRYDWLPGWPDVSFWVVAVMLPVLFQLVYRLLSGRTSFAEGLLPGTLLAGWIAISLMLQPGFGPLWSILIRNTPNAPDLMGATLEVLGHILVASPYLIVWVIFGSSLAGSWAYSFGHRQQSN